MIRPVEISPPQHCLWAALIVVLFLGTVPADLRAQDAGGDDPWSGVEEMMVTGNVGVGLLTDTSLSVTSFDAAELQALGIDDIPDLAAYTPNLEIRTAGSTTPILFIRGVGLNDFTANGSGSVSVYQDDVALNLPAFQSGQLFDTDGVNVVKGPQGSGPGRNASAGAIRAYSKKPAGDLSAFLKLDFGNYNYRDIEGGISVPLWEDVLSTRVSFRVRQRDGLMENRCGGYQLPPAVPLPPGTSPNDPTYLNNPNNQARIINPGERNQALCNEVTNIRTANPFGGNPTVNVSDIPGGLEESLNDLDTWAARGLLRFRPADEYDFVFNVHGSRVDQIATVGQPLGTRTDPVLGEKNLNAGTDGGYAVPEIAAEAARIRASLNVPQISAGRCRNDPNCVALTRQANDKLAENLAQRRPLDKEPFKGDYNLPGHERQEVWGTSLGADLEYERFSIKSVTGFERYHRSRIIDADYTPNTLFEFDIEDDAWQATQDLQLESELESIPLTWRVGGYGLLEELDYDQETLGGGDIPGLLQIYEQTTWSYGLFGEFEWNFADDFDLIAGVRYNWERKRFDIDDIRTPGGRNRCLPRSSGAPGLNCRSEKTFSDPTGVVKLVYNFSDEISTYWSYNRGWKGVQYNVSDGNTRDVFTFAKPETIDALEVGMSGSWFDGRLTASGAFFWYRYENYQVFIFANDFSSPPQRVVRNASEAQLYGAEVETKLEPIERLVFNVRFGWLESKFLDFSDSAIRRIQLDPESVPGFATNQVPIEYTGNRLPNTPRFKVSASFSYGIDLRGAGLLTPRYDFVYTDDVFFDPSNGRGGPDDLGRSFLPEFSVGQKGYWLHNVRLTYVSPSEMIEVSAWVRNVTNEVYKSLSFDLSSAANLVGNLVGDPRTYGAGVKFKF